MNTSLEKKTVIINTVLNLRKSSGITDAVIHSAVAGIGHELVKSSSHFLWSK